MATSTFVDSEVDLAVADMIEKQLLTICVGYPIGKKPTLRHNSKKIGETCPLYKELGWSCDDAYDMVPTGDELNFVINRARKRMLIYMDSGGFWHITILGKWKYIYIHKLWKRGLTWLKYFLTF